MKRIKLSSVDLTILEEFLKISIENLNEGIYTCLIQELHDRVNWREKIAKEKIVTLHFRQSELVAVCHAMSQMKNMGLIGGLYLKLDEVRVS